MEPWIPGIFIISGALWLLPGALWIFSRTFWIFSGLPGVSWNLLNIFLEPFEYPLEASRNLLGTFWLFTELFENSWNLGFPGTLDFLNLYVSWNFQELFMEISWILELFRYFLELFIEMFPGTSWNFFEYFLVLCFMELFWMFPETLFPGTFWHSRDYFFLIFVGTVFEYFLGNFEHFLEPSEFPGTFWVCSGTLFSWTFWIFPGISWNFLNTSWDLTCWNFLNTSWYFLNTSCNLNISWIAWNLVSWNLLNIFLELS